MNSAVPAAPRLSVVVPTHDTRSLTLACLASLGPAGMDAAEVVVVDDASRDGTAEAIRERYPAVRVLRNERIQSYTRSVNRGLTAAGGEILLLLNSDTKLATGAWEAPDSAFRHRRRLGVVGAALRYPDGTPQWSRGRFPSLLWLFVLAAGVAPLLAPVPLARTVRPVRAAGGGPGWAKRAAMALRAGGRLRLTGRALGGLFLSGEARKAWRRDSLAYGRALAGVREEIRVLNDPRHNERPTAPASASGDPKRS